MEREEGGKGGKMSKGVKLNLSIEERKKHEKETRRKYKERNKERIRQWQKEYDAAHKKEHQLRRIKFYKENPDYNKKYSQGCRHTLQGRIYAMYKHMEINHKKKGFDVNLIISQQDFFDFASNNDKLKQLFNDWINSNFDRKVTPSVDRIDFKKGYEINNLQFLSMVDNLKKMHKEYEGLLDRNRKKVKISKNGNVYFFNSHKDACLFFGVKHIRFNFYLNQNKLYKGYKIESFNEGDDA